MADLRSFTHLGAHRSTRTGRARKNMQGCATCRVRRKKCSNENGDCSACIALHIKCLRSYNKPIPPKYHHFPTQQLIRWIPRRWNRAAPPSFIRSPVRYVEGPPSFSGASGFRPSALPYFGPHSCNFDHHPLISKPPVPSNPPEGSPPHDSVFDVGDSDTGGASPGAHGYDERLPAREVIGGALGERAAQNRSGVCSDGEATIYTDTRNGRLVMVEESFREWQENHSKPLLFEGTTVGQDMLWSMGVAAERSMKQHPPPVHGDLCPISWVLNRISPLFQDEVLISQGPPMVGDFGISRRYQTRSQADDKARRVKVELAMHQLPQTRTTVSRKSNKSSDVYSGVMTPVSVKDPFSNINTEITRSDGLIPRHPITPNHVTRQRGQPEANLDHPHILIGDSSVIVQDPSRPSLPRRIDGQTEIPCTTRNNALQGHVLDPQFASTTEFRRISHIIPNTGPMTGGIEVVILGSHFLPSDRCFFGSEEATTTWKGESLICVSPPGRKPGPVLVTINNVPITAIGDTTACHNEDAELLFTFQEDPQKELADIISFVIQGPRELVRPYVAASHQPPQGWPTWPQVPSNGRDRQAEALSIVDYSTSDLQCIVIDLIKLLDQEYAEDPTLVTEMLSHASDSQRTLLHLSALFGFHELIGELISHRVDVNQRDKVLVNGDAHLGVTDRWGRLARELAMDSNHHGIEKILEGCRSEIPAGVNARISGGLPKVDSDHRGKPRVRQSNDHVPFAAEDAQSPSLPGDRGAGGGAPVSGIGSGPPRLVVSFDIGTSHSAVTVCYQTQGADPMVTNVTGWPGQESPYEAKVPSVLMYDAQGKLIECGAAASTSKARQNDWSYVENFKMHLHPPTILEGNDLPVQELPRAVSLQQVYADYLSYLFAHTRQYLRDSIGSDPWLDASNQAEVILTHPNRWGVIQQRFLQKAAVLAGLVPAEAVKTRLFFIDEAEAVASFCISSNPAFSTGLTVGSQFIVCDAGASMVDISAYRVYAKCANSIELAEIGLSSYVNGGGSRVDANFRCFLLKHLRDAGKEDPEDSAGILLEGLGDFKKHCKLTYGSISTPCAVRTADSIMNIDGSTAEHLFKPSVDEIIRDIQRRISSHPFNFIILTGGFGASPYLRRALETRLKPEFPIVITNSPDSKAVAIGSVRLLLGAGEMTISRTERRRNTWIINIAKEFKRLA